MYISRQQPTIELIYEKTCSNVDQARAVLRRACNACELPVQWQEWESSDDLAPDYVRQYGSPSILINGKDVAVSADNECACCRVYPENSEFKGCPAFDDVVRALRESR
jgi:hypothetical protein